MAKSFLKKWLQRDQKQDFDSNFLNAWIKSHLLFSIDTQSNTITPIYWNLLQCTRMSQDIMDSDTRFGFGLDTNYGHYEDKEN